jgi:peptide methionine sulfoxide reductase msrA/msrB
MSKQTTDSQAKPATTEPSTKATAAKTETAVLAGGCFWGMEDILRKIPGVLETEVGELLEKWFFRMHDPTTKNRQGNDVGTQYRSAIFVSSPEQRKAAEAVKARVNASGKWKAPVVTEIVDAGPFTPAEGYHQDYLEKNPGGYTCHWLRD